MKGFRGGKLKFKGNKTSFPRVQKTGSKPQLHAQNDDTAKASDREAEGIYILFYINFKLVWMDLKDLKCLKGPIVLVTSGEKALMAITDEIGSVNAHPVLELHISPDSIRPTGVNQVFIANSLTPGRFIFKTVYGKYLSSDSIGKVSANKEAVSPNEEWSVIKVSGGFALQNYLGKFLAVERSTGRLGADSEGIGIHETFLIRVQAPDRDSNVDMLSLKSPDLDDIESRELRKFLSWGGKKQKSKSMITREELDEAQKSGRLHEALLEHRMKSKHDPFC